MGPTKSGWYERGTTVVKFRAGPLQAPLEARGEQPGQTAKRDLARYYDLLRRTERDLPLPRPDRRDIIAAFGAAGWELDESQHEWLYIHQAINDSPWWDSADDDFQDLRQRRVVEEVRSLSLIQKLALADFVERKLRKRKSVPPAEPG
jgi:hypothetical protein